jgi:MFS family permease
MTAGALPLKPISPFAVFRHRNFSLMWGGQFVETIGCALTSLAASIAVYRITGGSALSVGLMLMASAAPSLLFGLIAGVIVDRYDRRRIMVAADVLRAILVCLIPLLVSQNIIWLYIIVLVISTIGQFFDPAWESVLPEAAPDEELAAANSLMAISTFGSTAIGFAVSGLIAASASLDYAFYLNAVAYLFSAACIIFIRVKKIEAEEKTSVSVVISNLKSGVQTLVNKPALRSLILLAIPLALSGGLANSLLLPFATRALNATEFEYGLQEGLTSVGFVAASLLMAVYMERWREGQWMVVSLFGMGLAGVVYSQLHSIPLAIAVQMLSGFMNAPWVIARRLLTQRNTEPEVRGRVASSYFVVFNLFYLVGMGAAGLADVMDVRLLYLIGTGLISLGCGVWALFLPGIGQPAAEWRRALSLLRSAPAVPGLGAGRAVLATDIDRLAGMLPVLSGLGRIERDRIMAKGAILDITTGTRIMSTGETGDSAYFVLSGKAVAGVAGKEGSYHSLSTMTAGDYFGEIAALTNSPRTADVVAEEDTQLLQVPGEVLRLLMTQPAFSQMVLKRMSERLARTSIRDLPRFTSLDPEVARELRQEHPDNAQSVSVPA